jgi:hypothetical protein
MSNCNETELERARRRLKCARQRLWYWSGIPSFTRKSFVPTARGRAMSGSHEEEYEMALGDVESWADRILEITGKRPKVVDIKREFNQRFIAAQAKLFGK